MRALVGFLIAGTLLCSITPCQVRIKDIAHIEGVRDNQLMGYGIVIGLNGTGDKRGAKFTFQSISSMLDKMGITVDPEDIQVKNVAAVVVTATLPPFAREGMKIDVIVSSIGDATSLQGGTLLQTPLYGADGNIYAVAQGPVSIGGFNIESGQQGERVQKNHPTVGRIPNGAIIERSVPAELSGGQVVLLLDEADFTTAQRIVDSIKQHMGDIAHAVDAATIQVRIPQPYANDPVSFIADLERLWVEPDVTARVVLDERTGTVVIGGNVQISPVALSHGNLNVEIKVRTGVSQPPSFANVGSTVVVNEARTFVEEEKGEVKSVGGGATIQELVNALNALGVTPRDMIAILQAIKQAGALHAELQIM